MFYRCSALTAIDIPDSVTTMGESVFYYCTALEQISMPSSLTSMGNSFFMVVLL
ncbi:MAG: leucine-rich repeat protein [Ruminococcus callidus]